MMVNRLFTCINMMLITLASFLTVHTGYRMATDQLDSFHLPVRSIPKVEQRVHNNRPLSLSYYNAIGSRDIFKSGGQTEKQEAAVNVETLKETQLKLKLWGTVTGDREKAYAVISEQAGNKNQDLYRIGDTIQNTQAVVKMILREKVVLTINDEDQVLLMEETKSSRMGYGGPAQSRGTERPDAEGTRNISLDRSKIEDALQDINQLMRQIKVRPHFTNGQPDGLALSSIRRGSIFAEMGLKNGDVIVGVDGNKIESVDDALKFYESISSASSLNLDIKRRGREQTIDYTIR